MGVNDEPIVIFFRDYLNVMFYHIFLKFGLAQVKIFQALFKQADYNIPLIRPACV